jgi:hypothetical protein
MLLVQSRPSRLGILNGIPPLTPPLGFANSMTLPSICPHCRSERVAADEIGCPQCGFVFEPEDGLELELIDDPEVESIERLQDHAEVEGEPSLSTQEMLSTQEISWAAIGAATARPKRAESSVLRKILPPILGGLCAVPIATAIMWYGFGRDLGTLGPTVAEFVPEIVPKHLRGSAGRAARQSNGRLPQLQRDHSSESNNLSRDRNSSANGEDNDIVESSVPPPLPPSLVSKDPPKREKADEKDESTLLAAESSSPSLIPSLLKSIRARQEALYESPKEKKPVLIAEFYRETVLLSQHSLNLQGRSAENFLQIRVARKYFPTGPTESYRMSQPPVLMTSWQLGSSSKKESRCRKVNRPDPSLYPIFPKCQNLYLHKKRVGEVRCVGQQLFLFWVNWDVPFLIPASSFSKSMPFPTSKLL